METICLKFPHIFEQINKLLNNRSLVKSKEASRTLYSVLENQKARKYQWIRIIQSYLQVSNEFKEDWGIVFAKMSPEKMKKIAKYAQNFCNFDRLRMERGWSPMHIAAEFGDLDFFKSLVDMLSVNNLKDKDGWSLVHSAAQAGNFEIYQFLVRNEIFENKNPKTNAGVTPLHLAARNGHLKIYEFISKHVDDINPRMDGEMTPLHLAAKYGQLKVYQFICNTLDDGNNFNLWNHYHYRADDRTPLDLALMRGHVRTTGFMISKDTVLQKKVTKFIFSNALFMYFILFPFCYLEVFLKFAFGFSNEKDLPFHLPLPPSLFIIFLFSALYGILIFSYFILTFIVFDNFREIFWWTDPITGSEFENFCKWIKSFDQDVKIMTNTFENEEMIEFD